MCIRDRNTIVIYVSDHGDFNGEYGLIRKGLDLLTHVPMVMKGPDIVPQGRRGLCFVSLVDMSRTLCDMFGAGIRKATGIRSGLVKIWECEG